MTTRLLRLSHSIAPVALRTPLSQQSGAITTMMMMNRRWLQRQQRQSQPLQLLLLLQQSFSSATAAALPDLSHIVPGATADRLASDPALYEYMMANFPDAFADDESLDIDDVAAEAEEQELTSLPSQEFPENNIRPLHAYLRNATNSRQCRRLRRDQLLIPGILHGGNPQLSIDSRDPSARILLQTEWKVLQRELDRYHKNFESRVYDLTLYSTENDTEGTVHRVVPQSVQRHPFKIAVYCANFCRYYPGRPLKLPIRYINQEESPAMKREAYIIPIQRKIEVVVEDGVDIPEYLDLECTGLQFKDIIRRDRLILPDGVHFSKRVVKRGKEYVVGVVDGRSRGLK